ncbi:hypothetical protein SAMN05877838_2828 [Hoeflea halophila]|uniref:Uncharacterized protein n=1 Tax=Hoeflea halophila TaxID=714899 RepID=A0A286ICQ3_9HYPH|nr:hypothetical protein [Hoeflea halophila]SOE17923.1 hypothetical protein SAMN05877838_2828 [Hoeflea halophila]
MSLKIDRKSEPELTGNKASEQEDLPQTKTLRSVKDMKFELERQTGRGAPDLEELEARIASVDIPTAHDNDR